MIRSLITRKWPANQAAMLAIFLLLPPVAQAAGEGFGQRFLDDPTIETVGQKGELRLNFTSAVRYVRHMPTGKGNLLKINVDIVDPCVAEDILAQETRWLPKSDWHVPVTVTFPDSIRRSTTGPALCPVTHNRVYVGHTVAVKFGSEIEYQVRPGSDAHSIIVEIPLLKQPESAKAPEKQRLPEVAAKPAPVSAAAPVPAAVASPAPAAPEKPKTVDATVSALKAQPPVAAPVKAEAAAPTATAALAEPAKQETAAPAKSAADTKLTAPQPVSELPAADLMAAGKAALAAGEAVNATQYFNRLLNLPPNDHSQEAQELVGVAREKAGEIEKATVEYQLYLQLYPKGDGAERVKGHLAALNNAPKAAEPTKSAAKASKKPAARPVKQIHQNTFTGSISQYYYAGKTQDRSINGAGEVSKQRSTDQSTLITNVDATERMRHNQYDTKIVFRDTQVHNFLPGRVDRNTVSAAFIEHQNKASDYMFRLGRQSGTSQGVLGRFDGIFGRYGLNPQWRITAVAGVPDNGSQSSVKTDRHFYGMGVEFGPLAEKWSGTVYGIQQVADGLVERRALGTELRYFSGTTSWFGLLDYDTIYDQVNMAMLQGNWTAEGGYNFNLLLDHRKSPILYGETAIQGLSFLPDGVTPVRSVGDLRRALSSGDIYSYVRNLVPESDMAMFGVTKQITDRWQFGGDVRVTHIGATEGIAPSALDPDGFPRQPGVKNNYTYTVQAIGTNTLFKNDTSVIMGSYVQDPDYNAQNIALVNSLMLQEKWRIDSALRYYQEHRDAGQKTWKVTPSLRLNYRWRDNMSFEAELNVDRTHTDDPVAVTKTDTWRETLFAGYRWDFR